MGGFIESRDELIVNTPQKYSGLTGVEVRTGKEAVALDAAKKEVTVKDVQTGNTEVCSYDKLVLAVGASAAELPVPGKDLAGVFKMRTPDDAEGIRTYAEENGVKKAVVIGAGFIGLEAAENLHARGIRVTVIDSHPDPAQYPGSGDGGLCEEASAQPGDPCNHRDERGGSARHGQSDRCEDFCGNAALRDADHGGGHPPEHRISE